MSNKSHFNEILIKLNDHIQLMDLNFTGYIGEVVAEIILLKAFDHNPKQDKSSFSKAILVEDFLFSLLGINNFGKIKKIIDPTVLKGLICFNHFNKKFDDLKYAHVNESFIERGAAGKFKDGHYRSDLFIPIVLESNEISFIIIEVKNDESLSTFVSLSDVLKTDRKCFEAKFYDRVKNIEDQFESYRNEEINESSKASSRKVSNPVNKLESLKQLFVPIVMNFGTVLNEAHRKNLNKYGYIVYDLGVATQSELFDDDIINNFKTILNSCRSNLKSSKYDIEVIKKVAIGNIDPAFFSDN